MDTMTTARISLEVACCPELAGQLYLQMRDGYEICSVMPLLPVETWRAAHRTARKRADRAARRGYQFKVIKRHERADEIYAINTSASERQGRPMSSSYHARPSETPLPEYGCQRHAIRTYGIQTAEGTLVAYLWLYRMGQLALVSQILGHADHLENEIMYLLWQGTLEHEAADLDGFLVYNLWSSGTDGLRFFKERVGLEPTQVRWLA